MAIREILKMGDVRLLRVAQPVTAFDSDELHLLISDMLDTMAAANGVDKTNSFKKAMGALATYRQYLKDSGQVAAADMELAKIQLAMGEKRKMLATYQRVFDLKPVDLQTIVCIEEAFVNLVPVLLEEKRFDVVLEAIDTYIKTFPKGKYVVDARMWRSQLPGDLVARADEAATVVTAVPVTPVMPAASTSEPPAAVPAPAAPSPAPAATPAPGAAPVPAKPVPAAAPTPAAPAKPAPTAAPGPVAVPAPTPAKAAPAAPAVVPVPAPAKPTP